MALKDTLKIALDETRMLILGSQILLGFQLRSAFDSGFGAIPRVSRVCDGVALMLMLAAVALLIAPSAYHRITDDGMTTGAAIRRAGRFAGAALLPFALGLGLDIFIAAERIAGLAAGIAAGLVFAALALFGWYGLAFTRRRRTGQMQRARSAAQAGEREDTPLHVRIEQMLTEARVILPGAQALLGFQLAIVLMPTFQQLSGLSKTMHGISLGCVALAVILLMAPAAYHRIVYAGEDAPEFLRVGGRMVAAATVPLAVGLAGDSYVVFARIFGSAAWGAALALVAFGFLAGFWHALPAAARLGRTRRGSGRRTRAGLQKF